MNILIAGGAPIATWPSIEKKYDFYIGVDRGGWSLIESGFPLDLALGDFDSLTSEEREFVFSKARDKKISPAEKDDTDMQLALVAALTKDASAKITIVGATGGRIDHFLANIGLVFEPRFQKFCEQIQIMDCQNTVIFLLPGRHQLNREEKKKYVGIACLTAVKGLTIEGCKYPLANHDVSHPYVFASNEFLEERATVSFTEGMIAVIHSKDV